MVWRRFWDGFGKVLGRFWAGLGSNLKGFGAECWEKLGRAFGHSRDALWAESTGQRAANWLVLLLRCLELGRAG